MTKLIVAFHSFASFTKEIKEIIIDAATDYWNTLRMF